MTDPTPKAQRLLFLYFLCANTFLSYASIPYRWKLCAILVLLGPPLWISIRRIFTAPSTGPVEFDSPGLSAIPYWFWTSLVGAGIFFRFYKLTALSAWPLNDESFYVSTAMGLFRDWHWKLYYGYLCLPPMVDWILALFFKILKPSLGCIWFFPSLFSVFSLVAGYAAARRYFPETFARLLTVLLAASFWPLYAARFCNAYSLFLPYELVSFAVLGRFLGKKPGRPSFAGAFGFGLWVGVGAAIYFPWLLVALWVAGVLGWSFRSQWRSVLLPFCAGCFLSAAPFVLAIGSDPHNYVRLLSSESLEQGLNQLKVWAMYLTGLFWTHQDSVSSYAAYWGGLFNPILSSFFILGFLSLLGHRKSDFARFLGSALPLGLLPAFTTPNLEMFRLFLVLPLILVVVGWGIKTAAGFLSGPGSKWALIILLGASFALDLGHLLIPYQALGAATFPWANKRAENYLAYRELKNKSDIAGPGYLLTEFDIADGEKWFGDSLLQAACYSFDARQNPALDPSQPKWMAVLTDSNIQDFLQKRFPDSQWFQLAQNRTRPDGTSLGIINLTPETRPTLQLWLSMDRDLGILNLYDGFQDLPATALQKNGAAQSVRDLIGLDPLLFYAYSQKFFLQNESADPKSLIYVLDRMAQKGYPSAWVDYEWGVQALRLNDRKMAGEKFKRAEKDWGSRLGFLSELRLREIP